MKVPDSLPRRMLIYRLQNNIGQRELARRCRLTCQTIGNIENGKRPNISQMTLLKIESVINERNEKDEGQ